MFYKGRTDDAGENRSGGSGKKTAKKRRSTVTREKKKTGRGGLSTRIIVDAVYKKGKLNTGTRRTDRKRGK